MRKTRFTSKDIDVNVEILRGFSEDQRHHQSSTFNVILVFATMTAGLCAGIEFLEKAFGPVPVALAGLASVVASFLSAIEPRRNWYRIMKKGFTVQEGLKKLGVKFIENPFGSSPAVGGLETTHFVHFVGAVWWISYLFHHVSLAEMWRMFKYIVLA